MLPFQITLVHTIYSPRAGEMERTLHFVFQDKRQGGEWFALTRQDVCWLQQFSALDPDNLDPFWAQLQEYERNTRGKSRWD